MLQCEKTDLPKAHLYELKTQGEKAFSALCQLSPKLSTLHRDPNDIKPLVQKYRVIASNLSLELKKYDIKTISKSFWKLFEDLAEIINGFLIGKLLPPAETLINTDHWDADTYLNKKISKICDMTLENVDEVDNTTNKAEMQLVEIMESLNRQLSSIGAVNQEDIQYMNFEEMILGELEEIYKKGKQNELLIEKGKNKLHKIILKIVEAQETLRRKFGKVLMNTRQQDSQTLEMIVVPPPDLKVSRNRVAIKIQEKEVINFNEQKQMLLMKLDHFQMTVMEKGIEISKLKSEMESKSKEWKVHEERIIKECEKKLKDMEKPEKKLCLESRMVDVKLQIIVSEKMLPLNEKRMTKKAEIQNFRNIMSLSEGRNSGRSFKNMTRQSSILFNSKQIQLSQPHPLINAPLRKSIAITQKILQLQQPTATQKLIVETPLHHTEAETLRTHGMSHHNTPLNLMRASYSANKIKKKELEKYIKIKKWRGASNPVNTKQGIVKPSKIQFKIEDHEIREVVPLQIGVVSCANLKKQSKENNSFLTIVAKMKSKPATAKPFGRRNGQESMCASPLFVQDDLQLFGGKQGAQKFQLVKIKPTSSTLPQHKPSKSSQILSPSDKGCESKTLQKTLVDLFESLRSIGRKNNTKYNRIINFLRHPHSYMKSPQLQVWQKKEQDNDIGFKQMKGIIMKLLEIHKDCEVDSPRIFCTHFNGFLEKIHFKGN